ncbi:MAG: phosphotransferase, partial [Nitrospirota bacterium]|nr:phosphotransferase [Nitrospirota bacterium]
LISLRYRPLLGETFLCNVKGKCPDRNFKIKKSFYFKIFQEKDGQKSFELLSKLKQAFPTTKKGIQVVNALSYSEALQMLILEPAPGIPLNKLFLTESTPWSAIENALRKTAKALAEFHLSPSVFSKTRSVDGHLHRAEKLVRFIQNLCPELEEKSNRLIVGLESSLQKVTLCPTHLDLKLEHIFIDEERITLIDLDSFAMSDPVFDVASLIVRIECLSQSSGISQTIIKAAVKVFTECYFSSVPIHWKERLHSNYCCASLKIAIHLLQHQETDAENRVSAILEHCNTQGLQNKGSGSIQ